LSDEAQGSNESRKGPGGAGIYVPSFRGGAGIRFPSLRGYAFLLWALLLPSAAPASAEELAERYRKVADQLIRASLASDEAWEKLVSLCDGIGHRLSGSSALARAVDWAIEQMELDGLENVRRQRVMVPRWVRGEESAYLVQPRRAELAMLGLGRSVATPPEGITAPVVVVPHWEAFDALSESEVRGRIVLFNAPFTTYSETVKYRYEGAVKAASKGALASLVRTIGRGTLRNPHTGAMKEYEEGAPRIPAAAISIEDALLIERLVQAGEDVRITLNMSARTLDDAESHNVIGEVEGRELPEEIVVIGGHLDSWDVGQGAHDDGGGCVVAMEAARLVKELGLRPRRTLRVVLWTNEENGTRGADAYCDSSGTAPAQHFAAIESDGGVENPWGFGVSVWQRGTEDADEARQSRVLASLQEIGGLLRSVAADSVAEGGGGADIAPLMKHGVPGLALRTSMELYWDIHHSEADTVDKINPESLRKNVAAMAVMGYVLADMPGPLD
jgi:carboxypeptidase Q